MEWRRSTAVVHGPFVLSQQSWGPGTRSAVIASPQHSESQQAWIENVEWALVGVYQILPEQAESLTVKHVPLLYQMLWCMSRTVSLPSNTSRSPRNRCCIRAKGKTLSNGAYLKSPSPQQRTFKVCMSRSQFWFFWVFSPLLWPQWVEAIESKNGQSLLMNAASIVVNAFFLYSLSEVNNLERKEYVKSVRLLRTAGWIGREDLSSCHPRPWIVMCLWAIFLLFLTFLLWDGICTVWSRAHWDPRVMVGGPISSLDILLRLYIHRASLWLWLIFY